MEKMNFDDFAVPGGLEKLDAFMESAIDPHLQRIAEEDTRLKAFDAADDARDIAKKAKHYEGKSTPFMLQAPGRGVEQWARGAAWLASPFMSEEEMQEFHKEDERIAAGFNQAMDIGGLSAVHKTLVGGAREATDMSMKMLTAAYTGGMPSLYVQYGAQGFNKSYHEGRVAGLSKQDSINTASLQTGIELGAMAIFHAGSRLFPKILPDVESRIVAELAAHGGAASGRRMASRAASKFVNDSLLKSFGRGVRGAVWEGGVETVEELSTGIGQAMARAATLPGAEDEANWRGKDGSVMNSPMMKTSWHIIRDTAAAMLFINGGPQINNGIRRFLNVPSRRNARKASEWLVAIGAAESVESLKDEDARLEAQQNALRILRDPDHKIDAAAIAAEYGLNIGSQWDAEPGELPEVWRDRGVYEVIPGVVLGGGGQTSQAEQAIVDLHNELGKKFGYKLRIVDKKSDGDLRGVEGAHVSDDKTVWVTRQHIEVLLNRQKGLKNVAAGLYAHELTHVLEEEDGYVEMEEFIMSNYKEDYLKARDGYKRDYEAARKKPGNEGKFADLDERQLNREALARWMENGFLKSGMLSKLAKSNMTLFERIRDWWYRRKNKWKDSEKYGEVFKMIQKIARKEGLDPKTYPTPALGEPYAEFSANDPRQRTRPHPAPQPETEGAVPGRAVHQGRTTPEAPLGIPPVDVEPGPPPKRLTHIPIEEESRSEYDHLYDPDEEGNRQLQIAAELENVTLEQDLEDVAQSPAINRTPIQDPSIPVTGNEPAIQRNLGGQLEDLATVRDVRMRELELDLADATTEKEKEKLKREFDEEMDQLIVAEHEAERDEFRQAWDEGKGRSQRKIVEETQAEHLEKFVAEQLGGFAYEPASVERGITETLVDQLNHVEPEDNTQPPQALPDPSDVRTSSEAGDARDTAWNRKMDAERRGEDSSVETEEWKALKDRHESLRRQEKFDSFTDTARDLDLSLQSEQTGEGVQVPAQITPAGNMIPSKTFFDLPSIEDIYYGNVSESQESQLRDFLQAVQESSPGDYVVTATIRELERRLDAGRPDPVVASPLVAQQMEEVGVPVPVAVQPSASHIASVAQDLSETTTVEDFFDTEAEAKLDAELAEILGQPVVETAAEPAAEEIDWSKEKRKRRETKDGYDYGGAFIQDFHSGLVETDPNTVARWRVWGDWFGGTEFDTLKEAEQFIREEYAKNLTAEPAVASTDEQARAGDEVSDKLADFEDLERRAEADEDIEAEPAVETMASVESRERAEPVEFYTTYAGERKPAFPLGKPAIVEMAKSLGLKTSGLRKQEVMDLIEAHLKPVGGWERAEPPKPKPKKKKTVVEQAKEDSKKKKDAAALVSTDVGQEAEAELLAEDAATLQATVPPESDTILEVEAEPEDIGLDPAFLKKIIEKSQSTEFLEEAEEMIAGLEDPEEAEALTKLADEYDAISKIKDAQERREKIKAAKEKILKRIKAIRKLLKLRDPKATKNPPAERMQAFAAGYAELELSETVASSRSVEAGTLRGGSRAREEFAEGENLYAMSVDEWEQRREEEKDLAARLDAADQLYSAQPDKIKEVTERAASHFARLTPQILEAQAIKLGDFLGIPVGVDPQSVAEATSRALMLPTFKRDESGVVMIGEDGKPIVKRIPANDLLRYVQHEQDVVRKVFEVLTVTYEEVAGEPAKITSSRNITQVPGSKLSPATRFRGEGPLPTLPISPPSNEDIEAEAEERGLTYDKPPAAPTRESVKRQAAATNKQIERRLINEGAFTTGMSDLEFDALVAAEPDFIDTEDDASIKAAQKNLHEKSKQTARNSSWNRIRLHDEEAGSRTPLLERPLEVGEKVTFSDPDLEVVLGSMLSTSEGVAVINRVIKGDAKSFEDWKYDIEWVEIGGNKVDAKEPHVRTVVAYVGKERKAVRAATPEELLNIYKDVLRSWRAGSEKFRPVVQGSLTDEIFNRIEEAGLTKQEKIINTVVNPEFRELGWIGEGRSKLTIIKNEARKDGLSDKEIEVFLGKILKHEILHERGRGYGKVKKLIADIEGLATEATVETAIESPLARFMSNVQPSQPGEKDISRAERVSQSIEADREIDPITEVLESELDGLKGELQEVEEGTLPEADILAQIREKESEIKQAKEDAETGGTDSHVQFAMRGTGDEHTAQLIETARFAREVNEQFGWPAIHMPWATRFEEYEKMVEDISTVLKDLARVYGDLSAEGDWDEEAKEYARLIDEQGDDGPAFQELHGMVLLVAESKGEATVEARIRAETLLEAMFTDITQKTPQEVIEDQEAAAVEAAAASEEFYDPAEDEGRISLDDIAGQFLGEQLVLQTDELHEQLDRLEVNVASLSQQIEHADEAGFERGKQGMVEKLSQTISYRNSVSQQLAMKLNDLFKMRREVSHRVQFAVEGRRPEYRPTALDKALRVKALSEKIEKLANLRFNAPPITGLDEQIESMEKELRKANKGVQFNVERRKETGHWAGMTPEMQSLFDDLVEKHYAIKHPSNWTQIEGEAEQHWAGLKAKHGEQGARNIVIEELKINSKEGVAASERNSVLGNRLVQELYEAAFANPDDKSLLSDAARATEALLAYGTDLGRSFYFLRRMNPLEKAKKALGEAFFLPPERVMNKVRNLKAKHNNEAAQKLLDEWADKGLPKLRKDITDLGWNLSDLNEIAKDPIRASQLLDVISQHTASRMDKIFEYWRNSILSALTTQIANVSGTVFFAAYELGLKRNMQAAANKLFSSDQNPHLPTFAENWAVLGQMVKTMQTTAVVNMAKSWKTEQMVLETQLNAAGLGVSTEVEGRFGSAGKQFIKDKHGGKIVRLPQRGLLAADEYMKTTLTEMHAMGYAFRAARKRVAEGDMTQDQSAQFIEYLMQSDQKAERIWMPAYQQALRQAWQSDLPSVGNLAITFRNEYPAARFILPFIVTPVNILMQGVAMSPFSVISSLKHWSDLKKEGIGAEQRMESVEKMYDGFTNTVLSGMWMAVLLAMIDEDEPMITGTEIDVMRGRQRYPSGREGELPTMSIRLPFSDKWFSYARIEPFATATALTIDLMKTVKHLGQGNGEKAAADVFKGVYGQVQEKTFMRGIAEVTEALKESFAGRPVQGAGDYLSNMTVSFVPNLFRSTARATQESVPERKVSREPGKQLVSLLDVTLKKTEILPALGLIKDHPKVDFNGREIPRHKSFGVGGQAGDFIYRLIVPATVRTTHRFVGDEVMQRYNNRIDDPRDAYIGPEAPERYFTVGSKKKWMSPAQYHEYCQLAGDLGREYARSLSLNVDNPSSVDMDKLREGYKRGRSSARDYCVEKFWGSGELLPLLEEATADSLRLDSLKSKARILTRKKPTLKSLSKEEKGLPYRMRAAILEERVERHEEEQRATAQELASEGIGGRETAAAHGGSVEGRRRIRKAIRTYGD